MSKLKFQVKFFDEGNSEAKENFVSEKFAKERAEFLNDEFGGDGASGYSVVDSKDVRYDYEFVNPSMYERIEIDRDCNKHSRIGDLKIYNNETYIVLAQDCNHQNHVTDRVILQKTDIDRLISKLENLKEKLK